MNFYRYVANKPTIFNDPLGLKVKTVGCTAGKNSQGQAIQTAAGQAEAAVLSCMKCDPDKWDWIRKIRNTTYYCVSYFEQGLMGASEDTCAKPRGPKGDEPGDNVSFFEIAFTNQTPEGCGCLQGLLLHEIAHIKGQSDPQAYETAKKCISCAQNVPEQ